MAQQRTSNYETSLGRVVVDQGLATTEDVEECLHLQRQDRDGQATLPDLLVQQGVITKRQLQRLRPLVEAQRSARQIPGYDLLEKIGSGAMAVVYKARQQSLDRIVAIKVLPPKHMSDPTFVERFYAEGRAAAKLNHPGIVQAIDVGQTGEFHYFVMEYVEGHTVFDHLQSYSRYAEKEALRIVLQVAEALQHAHDRGLIHRDVKPKNIMITKGGRAKLADLGLARAAADRKAAEAEAGRAFGTPYYISPEQIRGEVDIDFQADIYGLGGTLYHMVTGQVPFEGQTPSAVMHKHLRETLTPPDHIVEELSTGLGEVIEVMMSKKRSDRYQSTADMIEDLRAVAEGQPPIQARQSIDFGTLEKVERSGEGQEEPVAVGDAGADRKPLFWVALLSLTINVVLLIALIAVMAGK